MSHPAEISLDGELLDLVATCFQEASADPVGEYLKDGDLVPDV